MKRLMFILFHATWDVTLKQNILEQFKWSWTSYKLYYLIEQLKTKKKKVFNGIDCYAETTALYWFLEKILTVPPPMMLLKGIWTYFE